MARKKVRVSLHGTHNRGILIESGATEGAVLGENVYYPDGTRVPSTGLVQTVTQVIQDPRTVFPTLWALISGIPDFIKNLAGLNTLGFVSRGVNGVAFTREITAEDERISVVNGDGVAGNPIVGLTDWPPIKNSVAAGETALIPAGFQALVWNSMDIEGTLTIEGTLVVLDDQPEPEPLSPDFTYNMAGELTQIDYPNGDQKLFTYNVGGDLTRLDFISDGTTFRKDFFYTGGGDLDYITEYYV